MKNNYIPARYIGDHEVLLDIGQMKASGRPLVNGFGEPLKPTLNNAVDGLPAYGLRNGDTLLMLDTEVLGQTYLHDASQQLPSIAVGAGKVIMKEHEGLSVDELQQGVMYQGNRFFYEFSEGRRDFIPLALVNTTPNSVATPVVSPDVTEGIVESPVSNKEVPDPVENIDSSEVAAEV